MKIEPSLLSAASLKYVNHFTQLGSNILSTKINVNISLVKVLIAIDRLSITWKSDLSDKIKRDFFQAVAVSVLLYDYTTLTRMKKPEEGNVLF